MFIFLFTVVVNVAQRGVLINANAIHVTFFIYVLCCEKNSLKMKCIYREVFHLVSTYKIV